MPFAISLVIGGILGWLAGQIMKDAGYGLIADIAIGVIGGLIGGWFFPQIHILSGSIGRIIAAVIGAVVFVFAFQAAKRAGMFAQTE